MLNKPTRRGDTLVLWNWWPTLGYSDGKDMIIKYQGKHSSGAGAPHELWLLVGWGQRFDKQTWEEWEIFQPLFIPLNQMGIMGKQSLREPIDLVLHKCWSSRKQVERG